MDRKVNHPEQRKSRNILKRVLAVATIVSTMAISTYSADATARLSTVYHIYLDKTYIGAATDKQVAEDAAKKVVEKAEAKLKGYELELGNKLTYITEQAFRPIADNKIVAQKIEELGEINALGVAIATKDGELVVLKDEEEAKDALKKFTLNFVSEEEMVNAKARKNSEKPLPALQKDESRIMDLRIQENTDFKEAAVKPNQILNADDAVKILLKGTLEEKKYAVKEGDVLGKIASAHKMSSKQLMELNKGLTEDSLLQIGQELNTVITKPLLHVEVEREIYREEEVAFEVEIKEDSSMPKGETKVSQEGKNGKSGFTYRLLEENGKLTNKERIKEQVIEKPVKKVIVKGTKVIPSRGTGSFAWPTNGGYISSKLGMRWGKMHKGIDIARPNNLTIKAADHGIVVSAGWDNGGYGNKIVIDHQNGFRTIYAHLKTVDVSRGQKVEKGSAIGVMGSTGDSTGTHLHFEIYKNGSLKNPLNYF